MPHPVCAVLHVQGMLQWHFPTAKTRRKQSVQLKPVKPAARVVTTMLDALLAGEDRLQASYSSVMHTTKASQAAALAVQLSEPKPTGLAQFVLLHRQAGAA